MPVSERTYECVALEDPEGRWELFRGWLRERPGMSYEHVGVVSDLGGRLIQRLDAECFRVIIEGGRLRRSLQHPLVPDVCVVPADLFHRRRRAQPGRLAVFDESLPLVVEVWSPSTGDYDVAEKIPEYQQRGDLGICGCTRSSGH